MGARPASDIQAVAFDPMLFEAGQLWAANPRRPRLSSDAIARSVDLIEAWIRSDLPLPVRKSALRRGHRYSHASGRLYTGADNTTANWFFDNAMRDDVPTLDELTELFAAQRVPLAMAIKGSEKAGLAYTSGGLRKHLWPNANGWKLCHIDDVSSRDKWTVETDALDFLVAHVWRFLDPRNMFVVPIAVGGIAETPAFVRAMRIAREEGQL